MSPWTEAFIGRLVQLDAGANATNFYTDSIPGYGLRRRNLALYLQRMIEQRPLLMLIGEAPGYHGCRLTGVPFTSEAIITAGISKWNLFGTQHGYQREQSCRKVKREATATMMWEILQKQDCLPLLWNAFPLHPHKPQNLQSNRTPTRRELKIGKWFTSELLKQFCPLKVVAVGNQAHLALTNMGIPHTRLRHPSHGGKKMFAAGIQQLVTSPDCTS